MLGRVSGGLKMDVRALRIARISYVVTASRIFKKAVIKKVKKSIKSGGGLSVEAPIPKITIGIPVYNGEDFLARSIESILAQTYGDFCLIISDNCSTDSTGEICKEFEKRDSRVRYQRNARNVGASENYNKLCREASSPYFKWAAADDRADRGRYVDRNWRARHIRE